MIKNRQKFRENVSIGLGSEDFQKFEITETTAVSCKLHISQQIREIIEITNFCPELLCEI